MRGKKNQIKWMSEFVTSDEAIKIFTLCKMPKGRMDFDAEAASVLSAADIREAFKWLDGIYNGPYAEALTNWNLVTEAMWAHYDVMGLTDLREQVLRDEAFKALRAALIASNKPDFFKKGKRNAAIRKAIKAKEANAKGKDKKPGAGSKPAEKPDTSSE